MNFLITAIVVIALDRAMPVSVWAFGRTSYKTSLKQVLKGYRLLSFPRTLLAALVLAPDAASLFVTIDPDNLNLAVLAFFLVFAAVAIWDAKRAIRVGGYRKGLLEK